MYHFRESIINRNIVWSIYRCNKNMSEETPLEFSLSPEKKKPTRKYRKGSKYDAIILAFIESNEPLSKISVPDKTGTYLQTQLNKRIEAHAPKWNHIVVSTANSECYLENQKVQKASKKKE